MTSGVNTRIEIAIIAMRTIFQIRFVFLMGFVFDQTVIVLKPFFYFVNILSSDVLDFFTTGLW